MQEAYRLLKPGGALVTLDVDPGRLKALPAFRRWAFQVTEPWCKDGGLADLGRSRPFRSFVSSIFHGSMAFLAMFHLFLPRGEYFSLDLPEELKALGFKEPAQHGRQRFVSANYVLYIACIALLLRVTIWLRKMKTALQDVQQSSNDPVNSLTMARK